MNLIKTKVKMFRDTNLIELEDAINGFTKNLQGKVMSIDIKHYPLKGRTIFIGIVTYQVNSFFEEVL